MKRLAIALIFVLGGTPLLAESVNWSTNLDGALQTARAQSNYVLVAVGATYCVSCERNKREVFARDRVSNLLNASFNPVYIQADEASEIYRYRNEMHSGGEMMSLLRLSGFPTYLVFNGQGQLVGRISGVQTVDSFLEFLPDIS